jgi:chemotaxis protein methyltransferase CheR
VTAVVDTRVVPPPAAVAISDQEFAWLVSFLADTTGIQLRDGKQSLVTARLERRLRHHGVTSYTAYFGLLTDRAHSDERRIAIDLLTTNETYFFREPEHFQSLPGLLPAAPGPGGPRIWSAASSTGEEACTIALTLADSLGERPWEIVGTDISTRVLDTARRGLYPLDAAERIPPHLLRAHCLRGRDDYAGFFALRSWLRSRITYRRANLNGRVPDLGDFDVVFLRNVLIYFAPDTKRRLLGQLVERIRPGGHLLVGHAETLNGLHDGLDLVSPSVYRVAAR